jgi:hypothetical protein
MLLPEDQWHCVVIGLLHFLYFLDGTGWRLFGDWQRGWYFLFSVGLASVVGGPVSTGLLQQPLASLSFTTSTKS